jgi:shikimate dehydrogenase
VTEKENRPEPPPAPPVKKPVEIGGPKGLEPTRYGDWEHKGRCIDF